MRRDTNSKTNEDRRKERAKPRSLAVRKKSPQGRVVARADKSSLKKPGYVIDFTTLNTTQNNYLFQQDVTYDIKVSLDDVKHSVGEALTFYEQALTDRNLPLPYFKPDA